MTNQIKTARSLQSKMKLRENITRYFSFSAIVILLVGLSLTQQNFLGAANIRNMLRDTAPLMIMSAGMTSVLIFGSIDLSTGAMCSVSNVLFVQCLNVYCANLPPLQATICAFALSLSFGFVAGLLLGFIHVKLKVPSFIASLGFMSVWQSAALMISEKSVSVQKTMWFATDWFKIPVLGVVGLPLVLALLIVGLVYVIQSHTTVGKNLYAIGGNERAARVAGVPVDSTKISVFVVNGVCASLGGIFLAAKLRSSAPTTGDPFTLLVVASCVLGGTALSGGRGSVLGTIIGVFTVALINNGLNFIGVSPYWQNVVFGVFILAAIAISVDRSVRGLTVK
jgi:ribose/xylose/arabinose/galactoside ABC-type transport system permease subunit